MKRKIRFYILNIILFLVILGLIAFLFVYICCGVKSRTFEGSTVYTDDQLTGLLFKEKYDNNVVSSWFMSLVRPKTGIPFVEKVTIRPSSLSSVKVTVKEKERYGVVQTGDADFYYFDSACRIVQHSDTYIGGTPLFYLPEFSEKAKEGSSLPTSGANRKIIEVVVEETGKRGIGVQSTVITDDGSIVMHYGTIEIRLGTRANLKEKIMRLPYVLPSLDGRTGILHLEDWTEENTDIVFEQTG